MNGGAGLTCRGDFYKPTNIWTTLDWEPKGSTGNGKCACVKEHDKEKHEYVIALVLVNEKSMRNVVDEQVGTCRLEPEFSKFIYS